MPKVTEMCKFAPRISLRNLVKLRSAGSHGAGGEERFDATGKHWLSVRLARASLRGMEGQLRDLAPLEPDRRQDPHGPTPWLNHSWHVTLYVTVRGLSTSPIPYGMRNFQLEFDFINHVLLGEQRRWRARRRSASIRGRSPTSMLNSCASLAELGIEVRIDEITNELPEPVRFSARIVLHASYDPDYAHRFWRVLVSVERVLYRFRTAFIGKCSPVHFFWGSFDLAVTRFSGRRAPLHPGGVPYLPDDVTQEAYSHEVSSAGFWPGSPGIEYPAFYSYAYPEPPGFASASVRPLRPSTATTLHEFILPYDAVRTAEDPDRRAHGFLDEHLRGRSLARQLGSRGAGMRHRRARDIAAGPVGMLSSYASATDAG